MQRIDDQPSASGLEATEARVMGRLTFGSMYLELPIDDAHQANRKVLGGWGAN